LCYKNPENCLYDLHYLEYIKNNIDLLSDPKIIERIWNEIVGAARGRILESILAETRYISEGYNFVGGCNYRDIDFDGAFSRGLEVVSLKTYHSTDKSLKSLLKAIENYSKKLNDANLDVKFINHNKILDFVVKKGEWNSDFQSILNYIDQLKLSTPEVSIRFIEI